MNYQSNKKNEKSAQMKTIYVTLALALVVIAVLAVLSGSWRKSVKEIAETSDTEAAIIESDRQVMAPHTEDEETQETATDTEAAATAEDMTETEITTDSNTDAAAEPSVLPQFVAPVSGYLMKEHSGDTAVFSVTMNDYRPHIGVDISASVGDDVFASAAGTVTEIWEDPMSGNCISISHDGGAVTVYRNLDPSVPDNITVGASVAAGEVIGSVGESSLLEVADDPHVHFELTVDGTPVDPSLYIAFPTADTEYEG